MTSSGIASMTSSGIAPSAAATATALGTVPTEPRVRGPRTPVAEHRLALADELGARPVKVQNPCSDDVVETGCARTALEPFFSRLDELADGVALDHARITVLGNSLIASDHIVDIVRERLTDRFGAGGTGFLLVDRMAEYGRRARTGRAPAGAFRAHNFAMGIKGRYPFGVSGVLHVSLARGARTYWPVDGEANARVFWLDHRAAPGFSLRADGLEIRHVESEGEERGRVTDVALPSGTRRLSLVTDGPSAVLYGAHLATDPEARPGVVMNTFGVPAADARHFESNVRTELFGSQLSALAPDLVVVMLGGNETKRLEWRKTNRARVEGQSRGLLAKLREVAPDAACLVVGPVDAVSGKPPRPWRTRPHLRWVNEMQRWNALEAGCAFFDLLDAMGGPGALKRLSQRGLLHDDLVHPRGRGLDMLGELLADALLESYSKSERPSVVLTADAR